MYKLIQYIRNELIKMTDILELLKFSKKKKNNI